MNEQIIESYLFEAAEHIDEAIICIESAIENMQYDYDINHAKELIKTLNNVIYELG